MNKLLGLVALSMGLAMAACAAPAGSPDPTAEGASAVEALQITDESETAIAGTYALGESTVAFSSRLESPFVRTQLIVNGATFDYELDVVGSKLTIDGHSNTILGADAEVLGKLEKAFERLGSPSKIREALFKTISMMAAAPRGTTLLRKEVVPQLAPSAELNRGYCDSDDGITYLCDPASNANSLPPGCSAYAAGYNGSNPLYHANSVSGVGGGGDNAYVGGYVTGCQYTYTWTHEHEVCEYSRNSSYHGRVTWPARVGWSASACEGRCGGGCPNSYNFYLTKDCLDHDVCLNSHPGASSTSTFGDCGNEFDRASGDFTWGTGSSFASSCGFYMVGENSR